MTTTMYAPITLLNATYEELSTNVSLRRAARLLHLGKAVVHEADESGRFLRQWPWPRVIRLVKYVKISWEKLHGPPPLSRRGVLIRDNYRCGYCGGQAETVDHIFPRSRGGASSWKNLVGACLHCNNKKSNKTPQEAGMRLIITPYAPKRRISG
jgi:hypothetical protein